MNATLQIIQPKVLRDGFEIRDQGKLVGKLLCGGFFKPKAEAKAGAQRWQFMSAGLVHQKIKVYDRTGALLLASFQASTFSSKGSVTLDGKTYTFKKTSFWKQHYAWFDESGLEILTYNIGGLAKMVGAVTAAGGFESDKNRMLLTLLGLYNLKLDNDMSSASAGAAVGSVAATTSS